MTDSKLAGKRLLIVEDDWVLQDLMTNKLSPLKELGLVMDSAFDGAKAVELAEANRPDVILLDILLPGMTGFEFLEAMQKKDPSFRNIPVIVFTNLNSHEDREQGHRLGVKEFIHKADSSLEEISAKLEKVFAD
jgi:putative two-component system response regulator